MFRLSVLIQQHRKEPVLDLTLMTMRCFSSRWKAQPHWPDSLSWQRPSSSGGQLGQVFRAEWAWILFFLRPSWPQRLQPARMFQTFDQEFTISQVCWS